jgi:cysteinyl-tRNA synthetase
MSILTYNTLSRKKEPLVPITDNHIKLYVCGITSYDYCHIGHARSALTFDMIARYLRYRGYTVTYVRNFTDIDDKIINRANQQGVSTNELAERFIAEFYVDMDKLGVDRPTLEPRATEHIQEMIELISDLIGKGLAYQSCSDVYFSVNYFQEYGKLSGRELNDKRTAERREAERREAERREAERREAQKRATEKLADEKRTAERRTPSRLSINEKKTNVMDFVLWKGSKPGEPTWDSPWGPGRPGWHIECSAMSRKYLGDTFDIHGGGMDLVFPHHENEVAQSEGASGKPWVNTWIHHGFVTIRDEKMSKSLGNFLTIREVLASYHPEALRFFIFTTHYRNPLDYSEAAMTDASTGLDRLYGGLNAINDINATGTTSSATVVASPKDFKTLRALEENFQKVMDDDFNTPQALAVLFEVIRIINKICQQLPAQPNQADIVLLKDTGVLIKKLAGIMGLLQVDPKVYLSEKKNALLKKLTITEDDILKLIQDRKDARAAKEWERGDIIRNQLLAMGIELKDSPKGTIWEIKRS